MRPEPRPVQSARNLVAMRNPNSPDVSIAHRARPTPRIARVGEVPPAMEPVETADRGQRTRSSRVMSRRELLLFWTLVSVTVAAIVRYGLWWGSRAPMSPGAGAGDLALFGVRVMLFAALTFVVWHGILMRIGHWFQMAHMRRVEWQPPRPGLRVAFITCFVPGKEPIDMLETTLRAMLETRYPHDTWVLDEGNDPDVIRLCRRLGVHHFSRNGVERYNQPSGPFLARTKAGNHNAWRDAHESRYDAVAQLDVDHVPTPDYLERSLGHFRDPKVAFVVGPQIYANQHQSWIARGAAEQAFGFHGSGQLGYHGLEMPLMIGTNHVYRVTAMREIGGYAATIVEDHLTGMRFYAGGWRGVYLPEVIAHGEGPVTWPDYLNQQKRWAYGIFEILFHHSPRLLPRMPLKKAIGYLFAQTYYFTGLAAMLGIILIWVYFVFGIAPAPLPVGEWVLHAAPVFLLTNGIFIWSSRFNLDPATERSHGWRGIVLNIAALPTYVHALVLVLRRRALTYVITAKGTAAGQRHREIRLFRTHYAIAAITLAAAVTALFLPGRGAPLLYAWGFVTIVTFLGVALTGVSWPWDTVIPAGGNAMARKVTRLPRQVPLDDTRAALAGRTLATHRPAPGHDVPAGTSRSTHQMLQDALDRQQREIDRLRTQIEEQAIVLDRVRRALIVAVDVLPASSGSVKGEIRGMIFGEPHAIESRRGIDQSAIAARWSQVCGEWAQTVAGLALIGRPQPRHKRQSAWRWR